MLHISAILCNKICIVETNTKKNQRNGMEQESAKRKLLDWTSHLSSWRFTSKGSPTKMCQSSKETVRLAKDKMEMDFHEKKKDFTKSTWTFKQQMNYNSRTTKVERNVWATISSLWLNASLMMMMTMMIVNFVTLILYSCNICVCNRIYQYCC